MGILDLCLISLILPSDKVQHIVPQVMHYYIVQVYKTTKSYTVIWGKYHYSGIETSHKLEDV